MTDFSDKEPSNINISTDSILDNIPDSIWAVDKNLCYIAANETFKKEFLDAFGIKIENGKNIKEGMSENMILFWRKHYERGFAGEKYSFEYEHVAAKTDNEKRTFDVSISPIIVGDNEVCGVTIVSRDVSKRKQIENNLILTQTSFSDALLFSKMGNWELNLDNFQLSLSKHKQLILEMGSISEEAVVMSLPEYGASFVYPEDVSIIEYNMGLLSANKDNIGYTIQLDYRCITAKKNLKYFHLECQICPNHILFGFTQDITARKLAEIKLEESQKLYEHLVETLPDMVLLHRNGIIIFANNTLYKRTGFSKEEIIGKSVLAFDRPENHKNTQQILESRQKGENVPDYEMKLATKKGDFMHLRVKSSEVYIQQQVTTLIVFEDITHIHAYQEKLEQTNALLTSVINSPTQTIIFSLDNDYCYTSFNDNHRNTMKHIWGCEIAIGENMLDCIKDVKDRQKAKDNFDRALLGEGFQITEEYGKYPNRFFYENAYNPIKDDNGNVTGLTVFLFDVTSLKRTEEALIKSQKEVNIIFDNSFDAVFLVEEFSHKIIRCNRKAVQLFEVSNKQDITHTVGYEYFMPEDANYTEIEQILKEGNVWEDELEYVTAKGNLFWGNVSLKRITSLSEMSFFIMKISDISERKTTEKKLLEKQKQLEAIIENTSDFIWLIDTDYRLLNANSAFRESIFKNHNIVLTEGMSLVEGIPSISYEDAYWWKKWYDEALSGVAFVRENSFVVDDETIYWENSLHPVKEGNTIKGVAILSHNITERKRKEEEIRRSEEQLKYAIAATKEGVWDWDIKNKKFINNPAWYEILKYEPSEITNRIADITTLIHEDDKPLVFQQVAATRKGKTAFFECEYRAKTKRGEWIWVRDRGSVVEKDANGEATRIVGTLENITERKLISLEFQAQQKFIKKVINAVPNLIFVKDAMGRFVLVNKAFANYYHTDVRNLIGKKDTDLFIRDEYLTYYDNSDKQVLETGEPVYLPETQTIDEKTGEVLFHQTVKVLLTVGKDEKQILGVATDITERKKAEAENVKLLESLMQNVQDLEQFTYMVSHNLRSHVARILGLTGLLDKENKDNPFNDYIFSTVVDEATRLDAIIGDLNIILAVRNSNDEKREDINIKEMCDSVLLSVKTDLEKCGGTIEFFIPEDYHIYTIKTYSYSIILNLLSNAIKYRSPDRVLNIKIKAQKTDDKKHLCLSVEDNGLGINLSQNKDKVFGLYRRFHSHVEGKGIGLHITKTQIERMGGKIEIESELNIGTIFRVYFPI